MGDEYRRGLHGRLTTMATYTCRICGRRFRWGWGWHFCGLRGCDGI